MAKYAARGCLLKMEISTVQTTVAQVSRISIGATRNECIEVEALDDSGIGIDKLNLGTATQENVTATLYYDPDLAGHQFITDTIAAGAAGFPLACSVDFSDPTPTSATFDAIGFSFGAEMANKEALTGNLEIEPDGVVSWPTT